MLQKIVEVKTNIGIDTIVVDFNGKTASLTDLWSDKYKETTVPHLAQKVWHNPQNYWYD